MTEAVGETLPRADHDLDEARAKAMGLTELVAIFATDRDAAMPSSSLDMAKLSIFDWFAVLHAGATEPVSDVVRYHAAYERSQGDSMAIHVSQPLSARAAAFVNGTTSHAIDYDDTHFGFGGHPTVAVFPAVLAICQEAELGGRDLLEAFLVGAETACRLGGYFGRQHYAAGFHQTATSGAFGATAGVVRLLGLDADRARHALGLVSTRASGLRSQFGTMGKPMHGGFAAANGIEAVSLAVLGCVSRPDAIECVEGFAATHDAAGAPDLSAFEPGAPFQFGDVQYKFHACCHGTHGPLEAIALARTQFAAGLRPQDVAATHFSVAPQWQNICCIKRPTTGLEIKFSLAMVVAMALHDIDTGTPASFADALCDDPSLVALADKVHIRFDPALVDTVTHVSIEAWDGTRADAMFDLMAPLPHDVIVEKLRRKASALLGPGHAERLWDTISRIETMDGEDLSSWIGREFNLPSA